MTRAAEPQAGPRVDGRALRARRSRAAICEACLDLIQAGVLQPSADQIAERAGLSRRSVFHHFRDLGELYDAVLEAGLQRCAPLLAEARVDAGIALDERIELWAEARARFLEATGPFTRALLAQGLATTTRAEALRISQQALDAQTGEIERLFAEELGRTPARDRALLVEALAAATSPMVWEHLRHSRRLSPSEASRVMHRGVRALLAGQVAPRG